MLDRTAASRDASDLCWKVAYNLFEGEKQHYLAFTKLSESARIRAFQRCLHLGFDYALWRQTAPFAVMSPDFPIRVSNYVAGLGVPTSFERTAMLPSGAPSLASRVATCLLRYEGLQPKHVNGELLFRKDVIDACSQLRRVSYPDVVARIATSLGQCWEQTGDPDLDAFVEVWDFKRRQGGRLFTLLTS